jgi:RNA recognition motif-containing protein
LNSESYAFVEFLDPHIATLTLQIMNKRFLLQREMQISWVTAPPAPHKVDKNRKLLHLLDIIHCF